MDQYAIKDNYLCNLTQAKEPIAIYEDPPMSRLYQVPVYKAVQKYLKEYPQCSVLELGCGTGYKLQRYIRPYALQVTGADQAVCTNYAKKYFPEIKWIEIDLEAEPKIIERKGFDVIISADVIEHLVDPDNLLDWCRSNAHSETKIFLSTPERDLVRGKNHNGPPQNKLHVREWNFCEFSKYLQSSGFKIERHYVLPDKKRRFKDMIKGNVPAKTCQMVICSLSH